MDNIDKFVVKVKRTYRTYISFLVLGIFVFFIDNLSFLIWEQSPFVFLEKFKLSAAGVSGGLIGTCIVGISKYHGIVRSDFTIKEYYTKKMNEKTVLLQEKVDATAFTVMLYVLLFVGAFTIKKFQIVGIVCFALLIISLLIRIVLGKYYERKKL